MKLTLIVPTFNRAEYLEKALHSFLEQDLDPGDYEIIVIDNNSTDSTRRVVDEVMQHAECEWSCLLETRPGVHNARNAGIRHARGDIIVMGDDDIIAGPAWLSAFCEEFDSHPETAIAGGKVLPIWSEEPEEWIYDYGTSRTHPLFAYLDYGDERFVLEDGYVYSNNMAIRRPVAIEIGGCYPCTFPRRLKHLSGTGEDAMIDAARALQYGVVYLPGACVRHHADASRATLDYFIDRHERWAVEAVYRAFRLGTKPEAAWEILSSAIDRLEESEREHSDKRNPGYYKRIQKQWAYQAIKQTCRVLTEPALYEHITRSGYI